jgi:Holliday junction resolvasome RuvABC endonuclease subunit
MADTERRQEPQGAPLTGDIICGIDPGSKGALAFVDARTGRLVATYALPVRREARATKDKTVVDEEALLLLLRKHAPGEVWVEDVFSSPQMKPVSAFSFGENKGHMKMAAAAVGAARRFVAPAVWKRDMRCTADKDTSRLRARQLFPNDVHFLASEAKCEAALIALFGLLSRPRK